MKTGTSFFLSAWLLLVSGFAVAEENPAPITTSGNPIVVIKTDLGEMAIELNSKAAPKTVENFLGYTKSYFYDGLIFHRVIDGFVIQTGGYWFDLRSKEPTREGIENESNNGLKNLRGTIAMARGKDPDSARAQFYINLQNNSHLDAAPNKPGYTVFGRVISGLDIADSIGEVPVHEASDALPNAPMDPVQIRSVSVKKTP